MLELSRGTEGWRFHQLQREANDLFDRFFQREELMPSGMAESVRALQRELEGLFDDGFSSDGSAMSGPWQTGSSWPRFQTSVAEGEYIIRAELPGFAPEDIEVNLSDWSGRSRRVDSRVLWTGDTLTIRGELKSDHRDLDRLFGSDSFAIGERHEEQMPSGGAGPRWFSRTFVLPEPVEPYKVNATFANGTLEVRMPASTKLVGRKIRVRTVEGKTPRQLQVA